MEKLLPGFDYESFGAENEEDIQLIKTTEIDKCYLWATDWTVETLVNQVLKGYIILDPVFQRRDAWKQDRKSRFIESVILNLPIPQIVLAEVNSKLIVVDGKQRLLSLMQFIGHDGWIPLTLKGMQILPIDGKQYTDIKETELGFRFDNNTIRTVILKNNPSENYVNLIFSRLNTNSVALSAQELRQSMFSGPFTEFTEMYTRTHTYLSNLLGSDDPDFRMRDVELLIRFISFRKFYKVYSGNLKSFLDSTCKKLNNNWDKEKQNIEFLCDELEAAVEFTHALLGKNAFRKYLYTDEIFEYRFNRAIYDVFSFYFSFSKVRSKYKVTGQLYDNYLKLFMNAEFVRAIEVTTKSKEAVTNRFNIFGNMLGIDISTLI